MNFKTIAEAFNFYRTKTVEEMEKRAQEIGAEIDKNPDADIAALNIELSGIKGQPLASCELEVDGSKLVQERAAAKLSAAEADASDELCLVA